MALLVSAVVSAGLAVVAIRHLREQPPPPPPAFRLSLEAPAGSEIGVGDTLLDAVIAPDERSVAFATTRNGVAQWYRRRFDSADAEPLTGDPKQIQGWKTSADTATVGDYILTLRDGALVANHRNPKTGVSEGRGTLLAVNAAAFAASPSVLLYAPKVARQRRIAWFDARGARVGISGDTGDYWQLRISPDDRSLAVSAFDPLLRALDVLAIPVEGAAPVRRLTRSLWADSDPVWQSNNALIFRSMQTGKPGVFSTSTAAGAMERSLMLGDARPTDWRAGALMVEVRRESNLDLVSIDERTGARTSIAANTFNESDGRWSPDGRWIAFVSDESGQQDVYAVRGSRKGAPEEPAADRVRVSLGGGTRPRWSRDGRAIFFLRGLQLLRADLDTAAGRFAAPTLVAELGDVRDIDTAHRTDRIAALVPEGATARQSVSVVINWRSLVGG